LAAPWKPVTPEPGAPEFTGVSGARGNEPSSPRAPAADGGLDFVRVLALGQGAYYAATGVWSLVSIKSFQKVTGPKEDVWLVKTVGVLVTVIGIVLARAAARNRLTPEIPTLAAGSAAGLTAIDAWYAGTGRISKVYLLDAVTEVALITAWLLAWQRARGSDSAQTAGRARFPHA
jgi:hypothetical protein